MAALEAVFGNPLYELPYSNDEISVEVRNTGDVIRVMNQTTKNLEKKKIYTIRPCNAYKGYKCIKNCLYMFRQPSGKDKYQVAFVTYDGFKLTLVMRHRLLYDGDSYFEGMSRELLMAAFSQCG